MSYPYEKEMLIKHTKAYFQHKCRSVFFKIQMAQLACFQIYQSLTIIGELQIPNLSLVIHVNNFLTSLYKHCNHILNLFSQKARSSKSPTNKRFKLEQYASKGALKGGIFIFY